MSPDHVDADRSDADHVRGGHVPLSEAADVLLAKAQAARNGARFTALWTGDWRARWPPVRYASIAHRARSASLCDE